MLAESGGHRWQRVPPTERKGRVQTSTVTVAVFEVLPDNKWVINEQDILMFTTKDTGPGGQHRNKTESCVIMRHIPTGIEAKAATKSQIQNKRTARQMLEARVHAHHESTRQSQLAANRLSQVGSGMRGDKIRTYREKDNTATDHRTGKKANLKRIRQGMLSLLTA